MENIEMNQVDPEGIIAIAIPIVAIVFGLSLAMLRSWLDYKKKKEVFELHHRERMAAIEKGLEVPALPAELFANSMTPMKQRDPLRSGLIWTLVGAAISTAMYLEDKDHWAWGLIPAAIGIANLLYYAISRRANVQDASKN
jgi:hypothetical protein